MYYKKIYTALLSISTTQIKELIGISIFRIEWSKLFAGFDSTQQNEFNLF